MIVVTLLTVISASQSGGTTIPAPFSVTFTREIVLGGAASNAGETLTTTFVEIIPGPTTVWDEPYSFVETITTDVTASTIITPSSSAGSNTLTGYPNSNWTTSSFASSSTLPSNVTSTGDLAPGPVAGIAVGTTIAGVLIGLIAALFCLRRRRRSEVEPEYNGASSQGYESKRSVPSAPAVADNFQLGHFLLAAKPDRELSNDLQDLGNLIQQHVEDNYHLYPINQDPSMLVRTLTDLDIAARTETDPGRVVGLALHPQTRYIALRHIISAAIFLSFVAASGTPASMLPISVAEFVQEMPPIERYSGNASVVNYAFSRWRQLSAFLLNRNRSDRSPLSPKDFPSANQQARQLTAALGAFLGVFVDPHNRANQESHLQNVILECAKFGYAVFSQPAELRFNFSSGGGGGIVVHPGLDQVSDEQGNRNKAPRVICPPLVATV